MRPAQPILDEVLALYDRGLYLQAYRAAEQHLPLRHWEGAPARLLAGRLAGNLGSQRLAHALFVCAWRESPTDPWACYFRTRVLLDRYGPLAAWHVLRNTDQWADAPAEANANWLALKAHVASALRDFDAADRWLERAEQLAPADPWLCVERATVLEREDRYAEALAAAQRSLQLVPWYRPGVQAASHALGLLDRADEALALLQQASTRLESCVIAAQLAQLQLQRQEFAAARETLERCDALAPLKDKPFRVWLDSARSQAAYGCGDRPAAARYARQVPLPFYRQFAERLTGSADGGRRVVLPVGFVRQHHQTCAPATVTALSRYWDYPVDHLALADQVCYDGTPAHRQRQWAENHGWLCREFTVSWDSAVALLDRGVPFAITIVEPQNAHMQAVIGYDTLRGTLWLRDPYLPQLLEFHAAESFQRYQSTGPLGMVLVPRARSERLDGVELPDAELCDLAYEFKRALDQHRRNDAAAALQLMRAQAPTHRLTLHTAGALAAYDGDLSGALACVNRLLALFPDDANLQLNRLAYLHSLARRDERLAVLESICRKTGADGIFALRYAEELRADARQTDKVLQLLRRAIRWRPVDAANVFCLAHVTWDQGRRAEALELYRFAACLDDKNEECTQSFFIAARHCRQTAAALEFLENRFRRYAGKSGWPARTLFWALELTEQTARGFQRLEQALAQRPDDGELLLFAADAFSRHGRAERAEALLAQAKGRSHARAWLRTAADIAAQRGEHRQALALWRQVAEAEPLALDAHRALARLLAEIEGPPAALSHLEHICERFPHHFGLHQLWIEWLRDEDLPGWERATRRLVEINPADAWARRELAIVLIHQHRLNEAAEQVALAEQLEPSSPSTHTTRGDWLLRAGKIEDACRAYRQAIELSVDAEYAIHQLLAASDSAGAKREALAFIHQQLVRQVIFGEGLIAYRQHARPLLNSAELLGSLREAHAARPDLWQAWSALVHQLLEMDRLDEARQRAREAAERFPLLPRAWLDLARVCHAAGEADAELEALQQALQINPNWSQAARELAAAHERRGERDRARVVLEQAVARNPLEAVNHGCLAEWLWQAGDKDAALARVEQAVRIDPRYDWGWDALREWSAELGRPDHAVKLARDLTSRRPGEAHAWLALAKALPGAGESGEKLAALEKATRLDPRFVDAHDLRAAVLAETGRFDEALAACRPAIWAGHPPPELRRREALIQAQRGDLTAAVERITEWLREQPNDYWGWRLCADWHRQLNSNAEYLKAAQELVRVAPQDAAAHGFLGDARLRNLENAEARREFRRALELAPDYTYAATALFDEALTTGDEEEAEFALSFLRRHGPPEPCLARETQAAARYTGQTAAIEFFRRLCRTPTADRHSLDLAMGALREAGWSRQATETALAALSEPSCSPEVGAALMDQYGASQDWSSCRNLLRRAPLDTGAGRAVAIAYLRQLARAGRRRALRSFLAEHRAALQADPVTWGEAAHYLLGVNAHSEVLRWMKDWQNRPDLKPWMLLNLAVSLRNRGRWSEAAQVSARALTLPADHCTNLHRAWLALDAALDGRREEAQAHVRATTNDLGPYYGLLGALSRYLLWTDSGGMDTARQQLSEALRKLPVSRRDRATRRACRQTLWRAFRRSDRLADKLWALGRLFGS